MTSETLAPNPAPSMRRMIVAAMIGNVLEWFDFVVYGFFAVTIAEVFFPANNSTVSLLITFGAFGLAYFVRPLGAIVIGSYTDRDVTLRAMYCGFWALRDNKSGATAEAVCEAMLRAYDGALVDEDLVVATYIVRAMQSDPDSSRMREWLEEIF